MSIDTKGPNAVIPSLPLEDEVLRSADLDIVLPSGRESDAKKARRIAQMNIDKDKEAAAGLVALLALLFNIGKKEQAADTDAPTEDKPEGFADPKLAAGIAAALGLKTSQITDAVADIKAGKPSIDVASRLYHATDKTKTGEHLAAANSVVKKHYGLENLPPAGNANFLNTVKVVLKLEGGLNLKEPDGAIANHGINSKANPDIDVRKLTQNAAVLLYKDRYWDKINGIEKLDQRTALAVMDLAVNSGVGNANKLLKQSGGDVTKLMELRQAHYRSLIEGNPQKFGQYEKSWKNRMDHLSVAIRNIPPSDQFNAGGVAQKSSSVGNPSVAFNAGGHNEAAAKLQASLTIGKAQASAATPPATKPVPTA